MNYELIMHYAVFQFCQFSRIPSVSSTHEIASDALQFVDICATTFWTNLQTISCIFVTAIEATVAIVVHRAITDVVFIHQVNDLHN